MKFKIYSFMLFLFLLSCKTEHKLQKKNKELNKKEILNIIKLVENNIGLKNKKKEFYHFRINKFYNDTTLVIDLFKNSNLPLLNEGLYKAFIHNNTYIFLYNKNKKINSKDLNYIKTNHLISDNTNSPFFLPDTKYWNLLVEKKGKNILVKETKLLLNKSNKKLENDSILDF